MNRMLSLDELQRIAKVTPEWSPGLVAYHNDPSIKTAILSQLRQHRLADEIIKGLYWEDGKGCAVGCTIYSGKHVEYEARFGIPQVLAHLEDHLFEGLPNNEAKEWPERFMGAIRPGANLAPINCKFLHWILTDEEINPGINHPMVRDAVRQCADALIHQNKGAAKEARKAASAAAHSAGNSGELSAYNAAISACNAVASVDASTSKKNVEAIAWAAMAASSAVASAASRTSGGVKRAVYSRLGDKLISLLESA